MSAHLRVVGIVEIGRPWNSPKAVEGHHTPKASPFEWHDQIDLECAQSSAAFVGHYRALIKSFEQEQEHE